MLWTFFGTIFRRMGICKHQNEELWGEMKNLNRRIAMIVIQLTGSKWVADGGCVAIICVCPHKL